MKIPVVVVTGTDDPAVRRDVVSLGVNAFIKKSAGWSAARQK